MRKLIHLLFAAGLTAGLIACSSTTTTTVSTTDENGTTTTTTTTNKDGKETTETIVRDDPTGLREKWHDMFEEGAEGEDEEGNKYYFIYDDFDFMENAGMMILNQDETELKEYYLGEVTSDDEGTYIDDVEGEMILRFAITDTDVEDGFEMEFKDGTKVTMHNVDKETIIDDMVTIWEQVSPSEDE